MNTSPRSVQVVFAVCLTLGLSVFAVVQLFGSPGEASHETAREQYQSGNYKDAYDGFRELLLERDAPVGRGPGNERAEQIHLATQCLQQLGRMPELDAFLESVVERHADDWRVLNSVAHTYLYTNHSGQMVSGKFERGSRNRGQYTNSVNRDRVRALQLLSAASELIPMDENKADASNFFYRLANAYQSSRQPWQLQELTDLSELPDYETGWYYGQNRVGAPVDADGNPIYYSIPQSFETATSDGERVRWALAQSVERESAFRFRALLLRAHFWQQQLGVETLQQYYYHFARSHDDDSEQKLRSLHTLEDNETIARLANGIREFQIPDEFNPIRLYQRVVDESSSSAERNQALNALAVIFENRRQFPKAAEYWEQANLLDRVKSIRGNWGRFEAASPQVAGTGAVAEYRYRNGNKVTFEAHEVHVETLLQDTIEYINTNPKRLDWKTLNINDVGFRLITSGEDKYRGDRVAQWSLELDPYPQHFDRRVSVTTPLQKAGAYLVTARMENGNESHIVLWLDDTIIASKSMDQKMLYFVADAESGTPIEKANVEFFGYRQEHKGKGEYQILTRRLAEYTDKDGQLILDQNKQERRFNWLAIARTDDGRFAYHGFEGVWYRKYHDEQKQRERSYVITDRPVYRPGQTVHFKCWKRFALYADEDKIEYGGQKVKLDIVNPRNEGVLSREFVTDDYGGFHGKLELPEDAVLGRYRIQLPRGSLSFRVEEYKKPEFEVTVEAPDEPVKLGDKISATIRAKYYFGEPVTDAKVHYKVTRSSVDKLVYPVAPWDWLYGNGYWWSNYDYYWYPGWKGWGCRRPSPWWWHRSYSPPEVVAEGDVTIGEDGTVPISIDTSVAKALHGEHDQRYQITAEVVDASRRTIVGSGSVLAAQRSVRIFTWLDRGFLRAGDTAKAHFYAQTADNKPVQTKGRAQLFKISYDSEGEASEEAVQTWDIDTDAGGRGDLQFTAAQSGQYRFSVTVESDSESIEGAHIFTVIGTDSKESFFFNDIEIALDKSEYQPGDNAEILLSTDRKNSTVLLFLRPVNNVYLEPKTLRLDGKTIVEKTVIAQNDMPNFFVEALTISDGQVHTEARQVIVPPEKRVIDVAVEPTHAEVLPGGKTSVRLALTDHTGEPFVGSTVVSIYDRALEYISGGGNVSEIRSFFWKWRRNHQPRTRTSLGRHTYNLVTKGKKAMSDIGIYGRVVPESGAVGGKLGGLGGETRSEMKPKKKSRARGAPTAEVADSEASADGFGQREQLQGGWNRDDLDKGFADNARGVDALVEATVRKEFADSALWVASVTTDRDGEVTLPVEMPDNLTTWTVKAWAMGTRTEVGQGQSSIITRKNLMLRMQAPRFFTQKDECVLSANVHNYLAEAKKVKVSLELDGPTLRPVDTLSTWVEVPARGEARVDWRVEVMQPGEASLRMKALTDLESDAVELKFPVHIHGARRTESIAGSVALNQQASRFEFEVPSERRSEDTVLEVRYSPTVAGAIVDALPYLIAYPHGCTEQTLNRFLPAVVTQRTLQNAGLDLAAIRDKRTNLNALEVGDPKKRSAQWKRLEPNPVFDEAELEKIVKAGVERLTAMQLSDGGWGWFSGWGERSSPHTTATVVRGLLVAKQNDVAIIPSVLDRGISWLRRYQDDQLLRLRNAKSRTKPFKHHADNLDAFVFMVLAEADFIDQDMMSFLDRDRTKISVYAKAMYGNALVKARDEAKLTRVLENLRQYIVEDPENQTAYLQLPGTGWWYWYRSEYEAHAYTLALFTKVEPKSERTAQLAKYLLNNRKHANYWNSTRDTALCVESLAGYFKASGESKPNMTVEVWLNGEKHKEVHIDPDNLFSFDNKLTFSGDAVDSGVHKFEIRRKGQGRLYYNAHLTVFSLEDSIARAGLDLRVQRRFYRLTEVDKRTSVPGKTGNVIRQKVEKWEREEITADTTLASGDIVEVELQVEAKNDFEYIMLSDYKAAGFEPVDVRSGYRRGGLRAYMELRDRAVTFYMQRIPRGKHSLSYRVRAEIPGRFSALPTHAQAMYAPELEGNSDEMKMEIVDR